MTATTIIINPTGPKILKGFASLLSLLDVFNLCIFLPHKGGGTGSLAKDTEVKLVNRNVIIKAKTTSLKYFFLIIYIL